MIFELKCEDCAKIVELMCSIAHRDQIMDDGCTDCGGQLSNTLFPTAIVGASQTPSHKCPQVMQDKFRAMEKETGAKIEVAV
jgi:hypothetical protein